MSLRRRCSQRRKGESQVLARARPSTRSSLATARDAGVGYDVMSVEELQSAVAQLPAEVLDRFSRWLEEFLAEQWDQRIEADILAGRLDTAGRRANKDFEAGRCTPLPR